jgi:hypothetical protein
VEVAVNVWVPGDFVVDFERSFNFQMHQQHMAQYMDIGMYNVLISSTVQLPL